MWNQDRCSPYGDYICKNGGTCTINQDEDVKCHCPLSHNGIYCESGIMLISRVNYPLPIIVFYMYHALIVFFCIFSLQLFTKKQLDRCSPGKINICRNGGTCLIAEEGDLSCACDVRFKGAYCQIGR